MAVCTALMRDVMTTDCYQGLVACDDPNSSETPRYLPEMAKLLLFGRIKEGWNWNLACRMEEEEGNKPSISSVYDTMCEFEVL
jgi:hypothetical protein